MPSHSICNSTCDSLSGKDHLLGAAISLGSGRALEVTCDLLGKKSGDRRKSKFYWTKSELSRDYGIATQYRENARSLLPLVPPQCVSSEVTRVLCFSLHQHWDQGKANKTSWVQDLKTLYPYGM